MPAAEWVIERLSPRHRRVGFDCGEPSLSRWLEQLAGQVAERDLCRVYVAVLPGDDRVLGHYAISAYQVRCGTLPKAHSKRLPPRMDIPAALLGKLAVDRSTRGRKLGGHLLIDALLRIQGLADELGIQAVVVDAIDDAAAAFYRHYGFEALLDDPRHLFMTLKTVRALGLPPLTNRPR